MFFFIFVLIVILFSPPRLTTAAIVLFSFVSTEPIPDVKNLPETENQLLYKIAPVLISTVHKKEVAGHCPRYFRANTMFEVEALLTWNVMLVTRPINKMTVIKL